MLDIRPDVRYVFGSPEHAVIRMLDGYSHGRGPARGANCYALAGETIRRNEAALSADPGAFVQLYETPSGRVAHAALWCGGRIYHDPAHIGGEQNLAQYRLGAAVTVGEFLELARRRLEPAAAGPGRDAGPAPR